MARTESNMLSLGTQAPNFSLINTVDQTFVSLADIQSNKATVVMFICNHCPYVIHLHEGLQKLVKDYQNKGVSFVAINSNDVTQYPEDSPEKMSDLFSKLELSFPYLFDETQTVAKAYQAACTPDFFVFDGDLELVYRGQFDNSRPGNNIPVTGNDIRKAIDCILSHQPVSETQLPSMGCNIKWKQ